MSAPLLEVKNLQVEYRGNPPTRAVDGISFSLRQGENLGLVGESGCGKTTAAKSVMRLLPRNARIVGGSILWDGQDITSFNSAQLAALRWKEIALIPQSAMNSLDPVYRVESQIIEAIRAHESVSREQARQRAAQLCAMVGIDPKRLQAYPHQLSGGMKQRMVIAMALALNPRLIIADEPTTALDVIVQDLILEEIIELQRKLQFAMIFISHDIGVIAETCHRMAVMYAGQIVELGQSAQILKSPLHPYAMGLKNAFPNIRKPKKLISIPGHPPSLAPPPPGCRFAMRCPFVTERCRHETPPLVEVHPGHFAACHYTAQASEFSRLAQLAETWERNSQTSKSGMNS